MYRFTIVVTLTDERYPQHISVNVVEQTCERAVAEARVRLNKSDKNITDSDIVDIHVARMIAVEEE